MVSVQFATHTFGALSIEEVFSNFTIDGLNAAAGQQRYHSSSSGFDAAGWAADDHLVLFPDAQHQQRQQKSVAQLNLYKVAIYDQVRFVCFSLFL